MTTNKPNTMKDEVLAVLKAVHDEEVGDAQAAEHVGLERVSMSRANRLFAARTAIAAWPEPVDNMPNTTILSQRAEPATADAVEAALSAFTNYKGGTCGDEEAPGMMRAALAAAYPALTAQVEALRVENERLRDTLAETKRD